MPDIPPSAALAKLLAHPGIRRGRADAAGPPLSARASGFAPLDAALHGGWPRGHLIELIGEPFGCGETRLLLPLLAACAAEGLRIVLVAPPAIPWIPGWRQLGVEPDRLLLVRAETRDDRVWSCEQVLRQANTGAVLAWLSEAPTSALRRLRLAAAAGDACGFIYRPLRAARQPSPAHLRIRWQTAADHLGVEILKHPSGWVRGDRAVNLPHSLLNPCPAGRNPGHSHL